MCGGGGGGDAHRGLNPSSISVGGQAEEPSLPALLL